MGDRWRLRLKKVTGYGLQVAGSTRSVNSIVLVLVLVLELAVGRWRLVASPAPKGLQDLAWGFNSRYASAHRTTLKGC